MLALPLLLVELPHLVRELRLGQAWVPPVGLVLQPLKVVAPLLRLAPQRTAPELSLVVGGATFPDAYEGVNELLDQEGWHELLQFYMLPWIPAT